MNNEMIPHLELLFSKQPLDTVDKGIPVNLLQPIQGKALGDRRGHLKVTKRVEEQLLS